MNLRGSACVLASLMIANTVIAADVEESTKGDYYKFQLGGRLMYDYDKTKKNDITKHDSIDLRRGRIYIKGDIGDNWSFKSQFNINGDGVEDLYLAYKGLGKGTVVKIGNQKMPFMLEQLTSSKDISALERGAITERYAIGRAEGITVSGVLSDNAWYGVGAFIAEDENNIDNKEAAFAARLTYAPILSKTSVFHIGIGYKSVMNNSALGLELAAVVGSFHIQAEYIDAQESKNITDEEGKVIGTKTNGADGSYIQVAYILTGESRPYKKGIFSRVKPAGSVGAWEVIARYTDGDGKYKDIGLGSKNGNSRTIGVNWYAHKNVKFGINYMDGKETVSGDQGNELRIRAQLTF